MVTIAEIDSLVFSLSDRERAALVGRLLASLPPVLDEEDEGVAEALRRSRELEAHPERAISFDQLKQMVAARRP